MTLSCSNCGFATAVGGAIQCAAGLPIRAKLKVLNVLDAASFCGEYAPDDDGGP